MEYASALKSSFLPKTAMKSTPQQLVIDDLCCVTGINNVVNCEDFSVDDLLDFSDKDFKESLVEEENEEDEEKDSVSIDDDINSSNSVVSLASTEFGSLPAGELALTVSKRSLCVFGVFGMNISKLNLNEIIFCLFLCKI